MKKKHILVLIVIAVAAVVVFVIFGTGNDFEERYNTAISLLDEGKKEEAYEILVELRGYKDSMESATEIFKTKHFEALNSAEIGEYITFGRYEQDNEFSNGSEPIEWLILDKEEDGDTNRILIISKYALDCIVFDSTLTTDNITWQDSYMRRWLNRTFLPTAFDAVEEKMIESVLLTDDKANPYEEEDKVFLLSYTEVEKYLYQKPSERECAVTAYTKALGAYTSKEDPDQEQEMCYWWLRSIGHNFRSALCISDTGSFGWTGYPVNDEHRAVRPAVWLDLKAFE